MTADDIRVYVTERGNAAMQALAGAYAAYDLPAPDHRFTAFAVTGEPGEKAKVLALAFGPTEDEAMVALEAVVTDPPPKAKAVRKRTPAINHLAKAVDPEQAFRSTCAVEGCGRPIIRVFGVQARRSNFRHVKSTDHF